MKSKDLKVTTDRSIRTVVYAEAQRFWLGLQLPEFFVLEIGVQNFNIFPHAKTIVVAGSMGPPLATSPPPSLDEPSSLSPGRFACFQCDPSPIADEDF